jgi:hypothetical protein
MLSFGVTVLPDPPYQRMIELMKLAEDHGFEYAWTYDSHILWEESYATLPLARAQTSKIKLGHFVTNPGIRDPTITASWYATMQDISDGRMVMGIGRGDSSRRVVGCSPCESRVRAALRDDQGTDERPLRSVERQRARAEVGAGRAARTSRCGSPATDRRRSPSPVASATA